MKRKPLPRGPGVHAIDVFLEHMVAQRGGSVTNAPGGLQVSVPGHSESHLVLYSPTTPEAWATRLEWVEKQAAIFLLNAPILFGKKWADKRAGTRFGRWLRLSFGLSLSVGQPLSKRFVCFLEHGKSVPNVALGSHLEVGPKEGSTLLALPSWAQKDLPNLADAVLLACETFKELPETKEAVLKIGMERRNELTYLEQLYRRRQGANDRLHGRPAPGTEGSSSIEAEFRTLQNVVVDRYAVQIRVQMLTLGILEGEVPRKVAPNGSPAAIGLRHE